VSVFRRRRRDDEPQDSQVAAESAPDDVDEEAPADDAVSVPAPAGAGRENGPWDAGEVDDPAAGGRVDLGGMWLPARPGLEVRVEADQQTGEVVAVTLVLGDSALQVQPFAAPRSEGIWDDVRAEIRSGITQQGGTVDEVDGPLGTELRTRVPVRAADGSQQVQPARFVGVDGPRWFLRGVLTGKAAVDPGTDADLVALFRDVVVVRGNDPMAPRDPIPLRLPAAAPEPGEDAGEPADDDDDGGGPTAADLNPFERGPEITEIR
jgi:hypothetical protein